jgi:formylglycine-generating enzyme required for sulfatase activity
MLAATGWTWRAHHGRVPAVAPLTVIPLPTTTNSIGMRLLRIPRGTFSMGTPDNARVRGPGEKQHLVRLTRDFWIGEQEVTRGQFRQVMSFVPDADTGTDDTLPVTGVTWHEADEFCRLLSLREKRTYQLPSEAQWEYACRAGTHSEFGGTGRASDMGWYQGAPGGGGGLHVGGRKSPNHWGLFDFHGNVAEWCADRYLPNPPAFDDLVTPLKDPLVKPELNDGRLRVVRGGSFKSLADNCRSAARDSESPHKSRSDLGFRVITEEEDPSTRP